MGEPRGVATARSQPHARPLSLSLFAVLQYVLEHGPPEERLPLLRALLRQAPELQRHKYAQNVLAKCTALFGEVAQAAIAGTETESPPAS